MALPLPTMTATDGLTSSSLMTMKEISVQNRRGQEFDEVGVESFVAYTDDGVPVSSMGVDFRDWSNNGDRPFRNALGGERFLVSHEDRKTFTMVTYESGIGFPSFR